MKGIPPTGAEVGDAARDRGPSIPTDAADATEAGPTEAAEAGAGDVKVITCLQASNLC